MMYGLEGTDAIIFALGSVVEDMQTRLDNYETWLSQVRDMDPIEREEWMSRDDFFARTALEKLESITHIHTGSTDHMHYRQARDEILSYLVKKAS